MPQVNGLLPRILLFIVPRLHREHGGNCLLHQSLLAQLSRSVITTALTLFLTDSGLNIPLILIESLGAGLATVTRPDWQDAFASGGVGGLIGASLSPVGGFGKFCLVIVSGVYYSAEKTSRDQF